MSGAGPALFDPARHEPLGSEAWNESIARAAIEAWARDAQAAVNGDTTWNWHPLDEDDASTPPHRSLYLGASGVLWALHYLEREGAVDLRIRPTELIGEVYDAYLHRPDTGEVRPSYYLGEVGILLVTWRLKGSDESAERLHAAIERNIPNPVNEALWAAPGTAVGALHMLEWTGDARWRELFLRNVRQIWRTWLPVDDARCHLWTQQLYGEVVQLLGAGHGFAGNVYPLLRGAELMPPDQRETMYGRISETICATAMVRDDLANWPPGVGAPREERTETLVQWCHGAPGIITGLAHFPAGRAPEIDALLERAGNLVWFAGPLKKGHGICHGTAGNGYAFLKLYGRTGNPLWLKRARAFAMHAIGQASRMRERYGKGRHSLWTGDPGLAIYLWHCILGVDTLPSLDVL